MNTNYENVNLFFEERKKLFLMRFKKYVSAKYLGKSLVPLLSVKFVASHYSFIDTVKADEPPEALYSLTERYYRYCVYRRRKFMNSKIWPFIISVGASIATSLITTRLLL